MLRNLLATTGMVLVMSVPALAQTTPPAGNAGSTAQPAQESTAQPAQGSTAQPAQEKSVITKQEESEVRVYRLIGSKVIGPDGQTIGKVDDLLLDRDQKMTAIIVGVGGFLGVGSKDVALPASRVDISQAYGDERVVKVQSTKEELAEAPAFKSKETQKAEAEEQAARARAMQSGPATPGVPRPMPATPTAPSGSKTP